MTKNPPSSRRAIESRKRNPTLRLDLFVAIALGSVGIFLLLMAWWAATDVLTPQDSFARRFSPASALPALAGLAVGQDLWTNIAVSLKRSNRAGRGVARRRACWDSCRNISVCGSGDNTGVPAT